MRIFGIVLCLLAAGFFIRKLYHMAQIRLWIPGASVTRYVISKKWRERMPAPSVEKYAYWLAWEDSARKALNANQVNVPREYWESTSVGDSLRIARYSGKDEPYLAEYAIVAENDNMLFDLALALFFLGYALLLCYKGFARSQFSRV